MLKFSSFLALFFIFQISFSQNTQLIPHFNWSNPTTFKISASPIITGYGIKSDSISKANDNKIFYKYDNAYYEISTWADYYNWHVKEYWYLWETPEAYQYYYLTNDDYAMSAFVATHFTGSYYPAKVQPTYNGKIIGMNYSKYAVNEKQINKLKKEANNRSKHKSTYKKNRISTAQKLNNPNYTTRSTSSSSKSYEAPNNSSMIHRNIKNSLMTGSPSPQISTAKPVSNRSKAIK
jgi:hypothetical protein